MSGNTNTIPKNVAQSGYILMFRIPNFIEAILIIGVCLVVAYFVPVQVDTWKRMLVGGGIGFIPAALSLVGIKGETITRVLINFVRNRKLAKIYGPPSDAYKRDFKRKQLQAAFEKGKKQKKNSKGSKGSKSSSKDKKGSSKDSKGTVKSNTDKTVKDSTKSKSDIAVKDNAKNKTDNDSNVGSKSEPEQNSNNSVVSKTDKTDKASTKTKASKKNKQNKKTAKDGKKVIDDVQEKAN